MPSHISALRLSRPPFAEQEAIWRFEHAAKAEALLVQLDYKASLSNTARAELVQWLDGQVTLVEWTPQS